MGNKDLGSERVLNILKKEKNPLEKFRIADVDDDITPNYYGFLAYDGSWYILKEDTTEKKYRYASGDFGYAANFANRVNLVYDYLDSIVL